MPPGFFEPSKSFMVGSCAGYRLITTGAAIVRATNYALLSTDALPDLFTEQGYLVDVANDGQQGLHCGSTGNYDAMIVDWGLPVMDGAELLAHFGCVASRFPRYFSPREGRVSDRVEGLDAGAQDYLVKPVRDTRACPPDLRTG